MRSSKNSQRAAANQPQDAANQPQDALNQPQDIANHPQNPAVQAQNVADQVQNPAAQIDNLAQDEIVDAHDMDAAATDVPAPTQPGEDSVDPKEGVTLTNIDIGTRIQQAKRPNPSSNMLPTRTPPSPALVNDTVTTYLKSALKCLSFPNSTLPVAYFTLDAEKLKNAKCPPLREPDIITHISNLPHTIVEQDVKNLIVATFKIEQLDRYLSSNPIAEDNLENFMASIPLTSFVEVDYSIFGTLERFADLKAKIQPGVLTPRIVSECPWVCAPVKLPTSRHASTDFVNRLLVRAALITSFWPRNDVGRTLNALMLNTFRPHNIQWIQSYLIDNAPKFPLDKLRTAIETDLEIHLTQNHSSLRDGAYHKRNHDGQRHNHGQNSKFNSFRKDNQRFNRSHFKQQQQQNNQDTSNSNQDKPQTQSNNSFKQSFGKKPFFRNFKRKEGGGTSQ